MDIKKGVDEVISHYPKLHYIPEKVLIVGEIEISEGDVYNIEVDISGYPYHFPIVNEIDDRIPKKLDRHIYTDTGSCCFTTAAKAQILLKTKIESLKTFFDEILEKYLENNSYYEIHGYYFDEEYAHGSQGVVDGYKDILGVQDIIIIGRLIYNRIKGEKLKIKDRCYCGSGMIMKRCNNGKHCRMYREFKFIEKEILSHDLMHLNKVLESK
ncbi:hypothetical protein [Galbibacter orientalis]|uniref:hypothetical protein n=1 Tax=Galbibacter orientalis TaxID=453852 RepID=UPI003080C5C9